MSWRRLLGGLTATLLVTSTASGQQSWWARIWSSRSLEGDGDSTGAVLSADGRFVAFASEAGNLVPGDGNGHSDVFVRDRSSGAIERVSVSSTGSEADGSSGVPAISADGRFVAFESNASNLAAGGDILSIHVHDRRTGTTTRASVATDGSAPNQPCAEPSISGDGRFLVFSSGSDNLVADDRNDVPDIFLHDLKTGVTTRVSIDAQGRGLYYGSHSPVISADASTIAFSSNSGGGEELEEGLYVHDRVAGTTRRAFGGLVGENGSRGISISHDGRILAFSSPSADIVPGDSNEVSDIFVHDLENGQTRRISLDPEGREVLGESLAPSISGDGRFVVFESLDRGLAPLIEREVEDVWATDIYLHELAVGSTVRVSGVAPTQHWAKRASISADGSIVVYDSDCPRQVRGDANRLRDVFVFDRTTQQRGRSSADPDHVVREVLEGATATVLERDAAGEPARGAPGRRVTADAEGYVEISLDALAASVVQVQAKGHGPVWMEADGRHASRDLARAVVLERAASLALVARAPGEALVVRPDLCLEATATVSVAPTLAPIRVGLDEPSDADSWLYGDEERADQELRFPAFAWLYDLPTGVPVDLELHFAGRPVSRETVVLEPLGNRVELPMDAPAVLRGRVTDQHGLPVKNWPAALVAAEVTDLLRPNCDPYLLARTDEQGRYALPIYPGRWWLGPGCGSCHLDRFDPEDPRCGQRETWVTSFGQWVDVAPDDAALTRDFTVDRGLFIEGSVRRADGSAAEKVSVRIHNDRALHSWLFLGSVGLAHTEADGSFRLGPIPSGVHRLRASTDSEVSPAVSASAGAADVELELSPTLQIAGRVLEDATGRPCAAEIKILSRETFYGTDLARAGEDGRFEFAGLWPGEHDLLVQSPGAQSAALVRVHLVADEVGELEIRVVPAATLAIHNRSGQEIQYRLEYGDLELGRFSVDAAPARWHLPPGRVVLHRSRHRKFYQPSDEQVIDLVPAKEFVVAWEQP